MEKSCSQASQSRIDIQKLQLFLAFMIIHILRWRFLEKVEGQDEHLARFFRLIAELMNKRGTSKYAVCIRTLIFSEEATTDVFYVTLSTHFFSQCANRYTN